MSKEQEKNDYMKNVVKEGKKLAIDLEDIFSGANPDAIVHAVAIILVALEKETKTDRNVIISSMREHANVVRPELHPCLGVVTREGYQPLIDIVNDSLMIVDEGTKELTEDTKATMLDLKGFKVVKNDLELSDESINTILDVNKALYATFKEKQLQNPEVKKMLEEAKGDETEEHN
jgi:hypothetical protein